MKLFAKRSKPSATTVASAVPKQEDETVVSYFSSSAKATPAVTKGAGLLLSIEQLQQMDPASLNSKQRRMLKRMMARKEQGKSNEEEEVLTEDVDGGSGSQQHARSKEESSSASSAKSAPDDNENATNDSSSSSEVIDNASPREGNSICEKDKEVQQIDTNDDSQKAGDNVVAKCNDAGLTEDQQKMLEGLNSKERRKMLRQFQREQREKQEQVAEVSSSSPCTSHDERKRKDCPGEEINDELPKSKKTKKMKDLSHLPAEERERREHQRQMQRLAAERRASGEGNNSKHSHPLNSERRRANRRKPGKSGRIAAMRRENKQQRAGIASYNAFGYNMRKTKN
uniref:Uncharacterized protein n=1 Tax=Leptocylindrus danicus TaxID=163516 RepID=A0A7S2NYN5_9STRA|mmetsp:Transcript_18734/g.27770  ORF Transcript_18734/g.27770 Transcript_18734/m.27770 type:complete len:341 (+) Transcript_18734:56-1078(+)